MSRYMFEHFTSNARKNRMTKVIAGLGRWKLEKINSNDS